MQGKVLVTGVAGYIGSVLARELLERGYQVAGVDCLLWGDAAVQELLSHPRFSLRKLDLRGPEVQPGLLDGVEAIVHLAAIVGDPACAKNPELAMETNLVASRRLFELAEQASRVRRFLFASTCSNYGVSKDSAHCTEDSPLRPVSLYARTKVELEQHLLAAETRADFHPTALRFATAYGKSPRMRFDLTVNEFTRDVALGRKLQIYGKQFWRPYCHTTDLARACIAVLEAPAELVDHQVFNVGGTAENYTKEHLAGILQELRPDALVEFIEKREDPRDYRVSFEKIREVLSFTPSRSVPDGIHEIYDAVLAGEFPAPLSERYVNA